MTKKRIKENNAPYAVLETGGKQYVVAPGDILNVEKLPQSSKERKEGDKITFDSVLLSDDGKSVKVGDPYVKGSKIEAEFVADGRDKKVRVVKYKSKSRYFVVNGHRQHFSRIKILSI